MRMEWICTSERHSPPVRKTEWAESIFYRVCPVCGGTRYKDSELGYDLFGPVDRYLKKADIHAIRNHPFVGWW